MTARLVPAGLVLAALAAWAGVALAQPKPPGESCVACHLEIGDERLVKPVKAFEGDIHKAKGFGCVACHGGDARAAGMEAMDPAKGYIGKPGRRQTIQVCGRCHSDARFMKQYNPSLRVDQVTEYATSVHGRRLRELDDPKVATCANCHAVHAIKPKSDPAASIHPLRVAETCGACHANATYMAGYKIPTDQLEKYRRSVHWKTMSVKGDLSAPTCNSCHGNHGAAPPGISWVGNVCGQCHAVMAELFAKSVHARVFTQMGAPGCATCHNNHDIQPASVEMVGLGDRAICAQCHAADDKGGQTATEMRALIDSLRREHAKASALLERAEHAGMEVSQARFELNGANDAIVKARAAVHAFTLEAVKKEADAGLAISAKAHARGERAFAELRFRRNGLAVSLAIIVVLIAGLVFKIRQIERRPKSRNAG
ncbi:MAG: cytochrome c3 family protein [Candidatus Rokubacteria bacterium]|nr:cytochrome c3 family protein [Candidatus Rokubacteria bacterium]